MKNESKNLDKNEKPVGRESHDSSVPKNKRRGTAER